MVLEFQNKWLIEKSFNWQQKYTQLKLYKKKEQNSFKLKQMKYKKKKQNVDRCWNDAKKKQNTKHANIQIIGDKTTTLGKHIT